MAKKIAWIFLLLVISYSAMADEVLPSVPREKMSEYKNAFKNAISESPQKPPEGGQRPPGDDKGHSKHRNGNDKFGEPGPGQGMKHGGQGNFPDGFNGKHRPPGMDGGSNYNKMPPPR